MSKHIRAQMVGQVFIYVFSIILVAVILGYGYSAVTGFNKNAQQASYLSFKKELTAAIDGLLPQYGSVEIRDFGIEGYESLCFASSYESFDPISLPQSVNPMILSELRDRTGNNIFLLRDNSIAAAFAVDKISIDPQTPGIDSPFVACAPKQNGKARLRLEGRGDHVRISWGLTNP